MAASRSEVVLLASVPSAVHETTAVDNGFGSTTNLTYRKRNFWVYSSTTAITDADAAGWFAVCGSTSGDSTFNEGDVMFIIGPNGAVGLASVTDAAAGTVAAGNGITFA